MGRSTLKKKIFLLFFPTILFAQVGFVEIDNPVYPFLDRMNSLQLISCYNPFEKPFSRKQIAGFLINIRQNEAKVSEIDKMILSKLLSEFDYEIKLNDKSQSLYPNLDFKYLLSESEKYLYVYNDYSNFNFFVNGLLGTSYFFKIGEDFNNNTSIVNFGVKFRGTLAEKIGFYFKVTNGTFFGNKSLAQQLDELKYNFKFTKEKDINLGQSYFDFTEGYLMYESNLIKIKIGRDRENIGHGKVKTILGVNAPLFDYFNLRFNYKFFNFSYMHGKLLGQQIVKIDSVFNPINTIDDKYLVYHRFGIFPNHYFNLGFGEIIIYSNRSFDLSYLNPFNFYKSIEHSNQDRDNSIMFFDFRLNIFKGIILYSSLMIDDLDFGKLGTNWYGNKFMTEFGSEILLCHKIPTSYSFQYLKIDPYFYSHHLASNNYTNFNYSLSNEYQPNSYLLLNAFSCRFSADISMEFIYKYSEHGSNIYDKNSDLLINYGGNILEGHKPFDSEYVNFLAGEKEILRSFELNFDYEFIKNYFFKVRFIKNNSDLKFRKDEKYFNFLTQLLFKF